VPSPGSYLGRGRNSDIRHRRDLADTREQHVPSSPLFRRLDTISSASHPGLLRECSPPPSPSPVPEGKAKLPRCAAPFPPDPAAVCGRRRDRPGGPPADDNGFRDPNAGASTAIVGSGGTVVLVEEVASCVVAPCAGAAVVDAKR
jgi:hypothetical protein